MNEAITNISAGYMKEVNIVRETIDYRNDVGAAQQ